MTEYRHVPVATYRLQLNTGFTFDDARAQLDYLARLGITDLYLSPIMQARTGSSHGYDVTNPALISAELGGDEAFVRLAEAARECGMGVLLDIVPNHMAATIENPRWSDLLANGPASPAAYVFDVFWDEDGKLVLPILGDHYANVLERDELTLTWAEDGPHITYFDNHLPVSRGADSLAALEAWDQPLSPDEHRAALDRLVAAQHYRLSYWRTASRVVNYRRFFDINDLAAVKFDGEAFEFIHDRVRELVGSGQVTGLRIDHVDGLRDPAGYLERLQSFLRTSETHEDIYVLVEKILTGGERLPSDWRTAGTTGYDFLNMTSGALTSGAGLQGLIEMTRRYAPEVADFSDLLQHAKHQIIEELFAADSARLTRRLGRIARNDRYGRDLIDPELDAAIRELTVCLPVYRTYIARPSIRSEDRTLVERAMAEALEYRPDLRVALEFLARVILLDGHVKLGEADVQARLDFIAAWQQFSGPVMAKGLEDTTLYRDPTLLSANAVGGERDVAEITVADFHAWARERAEHWPLAMNATSTHDSKRSEDVRARIAVLSEIPDEWDAEFEHLRDTSASDVRSVDDQPAPDGRAALMLFQTLIGSWPLAPGELDDYLERVQAYAVKAEREAKLRTSWIDQNAVYEEALQAFIADLFRNERFLAQLRPFREQIAVHGMLNSLSATLLKVTAPGVPDTYQGAEIWDFSLVDPDNRRPVDYAVRRTLLQRIESASSPGTLLRDWQSGAIKLFVLRHALQTRAVRRDLFERGSYQPLEIEGAHSNHVIAFARNAGDAWAITIVPRLTAHLTRTTGHALGHIPLGPATWSETQLRLPRDAPPGWTDALTGSRIDASARRLSVGNVFAELPFALLAGDQ